MNPNFKAFLLSTFILPGTGQFYKGDKIKGAILILLVNIFLLVALFLVLQGLGPAIVTARISGTAADPAALVDQLHRQGGPARWLLGCFVALWAYGSIDAALSQGANKGD